ncbi:NAD(P)-dependent oxidoreductase [Pyxidicoccus fallax]|uniref:NAD(P)-dependent oxidoreductase n=1 Tax=Pyxidicoccus fallax TaxID=394095 RepID=A0A848LEV0_9BACT|nr:NAD(P)-dependent oxidoreductase [Pyxidicoccus fallax]NMO15375.1 NAD(P)-dependent oxidoreductase [Pyxidicoccus fallax]NPC79217.1 NAD(P)-dependent oxidoreductase [Pyxidicoccus fallax]
MSTHTQKPVLIIGGSGLVGAQAAKALRRLHPGLPITIGGRNLARADAVAREVGGADTARIDLERPDLGLPASAAYSAVVIFVKDDTLNSLRYAQAKGIPYLGISTNLFEVGPEVALYIHNPTSAPILMASHWLVGMATLATLHFAREFQSIDAIEIAAVLDEEDMGGPAAYADFERMTKSAAGTLLLKDGKWLWAHGDEAKRTLRGVDGGELSVQAYSPLDVMSLAAATDARSIRFDLAVGQSASRKRGEPFSTELIIEITGRRQDGTTGRVRHELVHPAGQAPATAMGVAVATERLLGLAGGPPVAPGLYLPDVLIDPAYLLRRLEETGLQLRRA